ncbi:hypothetical protein [Acidithiobacillus caldus]|uniref:hypothetical protein n=1 Tax=Acidithiobacillus caldus TaxID=33059 RepID=UPI001C06A1D2|nr:hypothetical protein [Acidithiobacillus caldus]MBU2771595.1 hypothetical protein [Acidithiobacillus caldus]
MDMQELQKRAETLAQQCAAAGAALLVIDNKKRKRNVGYDLAIERLARDLHRTSVEVDILTAQILGTDHHGKGEAA